MALSKTKFEDAFKYRIVQETACDNSAIVNATSESGSIYAIHFVNGSSAASLKVFDAEAVTLGSTNADMVFRIPASSTTMIEIPDGLPFTYLSFAVTANPNPSDNTAPAAGVNVRFLVR
jgi:hypothetical protein|tara:strand:- start:1543 stop:1899 length:357 start_codon:yes stop_codon:yes gene_type:complete